MARAVKKSRSKKAMDDLVFKMQLKEERLGEPDWATIKFASEADLAEAFNFISQHWTVEDGRKFLVDYLKFISLPKGDLALVLNATDHDMIAVGQSIGWTARLLKAGAKLPQTVTARFGQKVFALVDRVKVREATEAAAVVVPRRTVKENVRGVAGNIIADIDDALDAFNLRGEEFSPADYIRNRAIKPMVAKMVAEHFKPIYQEVFDAASGKDADLKFAYSHIKKAKLKSLVEFLRQVVAAFDQTVVTAVKTPRKARAKKVKPASVVVSKLKYTAAFGDIKSVNPTKVVGANQLWVYNVKKRTLGVYNAMGPSGLSVKGTTLIGYDPATAVSKRLRKPEETIKTVLETGKVGLRTVLDKVKAKPRGLTGRLNADTLLVRIM